MDIKEPADMERSRASNFLSRLQGRMGLLDSHNSKVGVVLRQLVEVQRMCHRAISRL